MEKSGFQINNEKFFRSESFSKGRAPASELVLLRGGLASEIALQGGSLESKIVCRGVGANFEKPKKFRRFHVRFHGGIPGGIPRWIPRWIPGWIPRCYGRASWIVPYIFGPSHSLRAELPLPSSCCKGEACFPRSHYKGEALSPKLCYEG